MSIINVVRRAVAASVVLPLVLLSAGCAGDHGATTGPVAPPPDDPPPSSIAARYQLTSANGKPLPAEVYAGVYLDQATGAFHDLRIVATDGYVDLHDDGTFAHYVSLRAVVDGDLVGTPRYVDYGLWFAIPHSTDVRFESSFRQWPGVFHGVAQAGTVRLDQELTGGEVGAGSVRYEYTREGLR
ncbi:MAG: hypothetical protein KGN74_04475 [Gemmatimonadota bacterium]|nr:hypothetical protein [Gemmatimonadota bacterium]MDE3215687.1 hypothetical protein [Gemmatimonadota bacterium]